MFSLKTFLTAEVSVFCKRLLLQEKKIPVPFLSHGKVGKGGRTQSFYILTEDNEILQSYGLRSLFIEGHYSH